MLINRKNIENFVPLKNNKTCLAYKIVNLLYNWITNSENTILKDYYDEWRSLFVNVHGILERKKKVDRKELYELYRFNKDDKESLMRFIFALETYYSILLKLIGYGVISENYSKPDLIPLSQFSNLTGPKFLSEFRRIETGEIFRDVQISNYIYKNVLSWYLEFFNDEFLNLLKILISKFNFTNKGTSAYDSDLIKVLYQKLFPSAFRHSVGAYYTPDWLALWILKTLNYSRNKSEIFSFRYLDPACGSGTFIMLLINETLSNMHNENVKLQDIMNWVTNNIVGFDLDPIAALEARTNYLISIATLLKSRKSSNSKNIFIPIYNCDTINAPYPIENKQQTLFPNKEHLIVNTVWGTFEIPLSILRIEKLQDLFMDIEKTLEDQMDFETTFNHLSNRYLVTDENQHDFKLFLKQLYEKLQNISEVAFRYTAFNKLINSIAPAYLGKFEVVIGNPPWVNWEYLPKAYKKKTEILWQHYGLFDLKGRDATFIKEDISVLMTYVVADRHLVDGGILSFVIKQSLFKSSLHGEGFRKFKILPTNSHLKVQRVDDLVSIRPFENVNNRTAILFLKKNEKNVYPVPYFIWKKKGKKRISENFDLDTILKETMKLNHFAFPADKLNMNSGWISGPKGVISVLKKVLGTSYYRARSGIFTGGANGVYWVDVIAVLNNGTIQIENITRNVKRKVPMVNVLIENDLVFPLAQGRDLTRWACTPNAYIICPHTSKTKMKPISISEMKEKYPLTYKYLENFRNILEQRRGFAGWEKDIQKAYFYAIQRIGDYTFAPYKVAWRYIATDFIVAVVSSANDSKTTNKIVLPNEKNMFVGLNSEEEAYYLCALLSSSPYRYTVRSFMVETQIAPYILQKLRIPQFDSQNELHLKLSRLCKEGHKLVAKNELKNIMKVNNEIDLVVSKMLSIENDELTCVVSALYDLDK